MVDASMKLHWNLHVADYSSLFLSSGVCGGCPSNIVNLQVTAEPQELTSPGYPNDYAR